MGCYGNQHGGWGVVEDNCLKSCPGFFRLSGRTSRQPKQSCFRSRRHYWAVTLIFIRLSDSYLQTSLCSATLYQRADSQLEQAVVIWQFEFAHESSPPGPISDSSVVLILLGSCLSEPAVTARHLWEGASGALAFLTPESEVETDCQHITRGCKIALKH